MRPRGSFWESSNSGSHLHWAPACPDAPGSGSRGVGRECPGPDFPGPVRSHQVALHPHLSPGIPLLSPEILLPESVRFSHFSPPQGLHFSSGYHHLLSTGSLADLPASGLVWMFCAIGSRKPSLGGLAAWKQWQSRALWVTLGGEKGAQLPCVFAPPLPPLVYLLEGLWGHRKPPQHQHNLH